MRVFETSGIIDRPYNGLYVLTIPLYKCMERLSRYMLPIVSNGADRVGFSRSLPISETALDIASVAYMYITFTHYG